MTSAFDKFKQNAKKYNLIPTKAGLKKAALNVTGLLAVAIGVGVAGLGATSMYGTALNADMPNNLSSFLQKNNLPSEKVSEWVGRPVHVIDRTELEGFSDWAKAYSQYVGFANIGGAQFVTAYEGFKSVTNKGGAFVMGRVDEKNRKLTYMPYLASEERWLERLGFGFDVDMDAQVNTITSEQATNAVIIHELTHAKGEEPNKEYINNSKERGQWLENRADFGIVKFQKELGVDDHFIERFAAARMMSEILPYQLDFYDHMRGRDHGFQEYGQLSFQSGHATSMSLYGYLKTGDVPSIDELSKSVHEHYVEVSDLTQKLADHFAEEKLTRAKGFQLKLLGGMQALDQAGSLSLYQQNYMDRYEHSIRFLNPKLGLKLDEKKSLQAKTRAPITQANAKPSLSK